MKDLSFRKYPSLSSFPIPSGDLTGMTMYHSVLNEVYVCDGTEWIPIFQPRFWSGNVASASGSSAIPFAVTPPLKTAGVEVMSQSVTPRHSNHKYHIQASITLSSATYNRGGSIVLWRDDTFICAASYQSPTVSSGISYNTITHTLSINKVDAPGTTSPVVYSIRVGAESGTWYVARREGENTFGGLNNGWSITEVMR